MAPETQSGRGWVLEVVGVRGATRGSKGNQGHGENEGRVYYLCISRRLPGKRETKAVSTVQIATVVGHQNPVLLRPGEKF